MYTTRIHLYLTLLALACTTFGASPIQPGQIKNLVTFGDSYTDLSYRLPADGGRRWPLWVAGYGPFNLHGIPQLLVSILISTSDSLAQALPRLAQLVPIISLIVPSPQSWSTSFPTTSTSPAMALFLPPVSFPMKPCTLSGSAPMMSA